MNSGKQNEVQDAEVIDGDQKYLPERGRIKAGAVLTPAFRYALSNMLLSAPDGKMHK